MQAYVRIRGPLGPPREDLRAALVAYTTVASHSRKPRRHRLEQFVLSFDRGHGRVVDLDDEDDVVDGADTDDR